MTEQNAVHIDDVIAEYNQKAKRLIELTTDGVMWVVEQNGEYIPWVPDNVIIFPAHRRVQ